MKYPQIHVISKYQDFLNNLGTVGTPKKVDQAYVKQLGYKSSYDANFLAAIKYIGLVEEKREGAPTELWKKLRTEPGNALAECLKSGYSELFEFFPDAHQRDDEALTNYFRGNSEGNADEVTRMVNAFNAVRQLASFGEDFQNEEAVVEEIVKEKAIKKGKSPVVEMPVGTGSPTVNVNIQLQLPPDTTGDNYDKFFESMKKHLFP